MAAKGKYTKQDFEGLPYYLNPTLPDFRSETELRKHVIRDTEYERFFQNLHTSLVLREKSRIQPPIMHYGFALNRRMMDIAREKNLLRTIMVGCLPGVSPPKDAVWDPTACTYFEPNWAQTAVTMVKHFRKRNPSKTFKPLAVWTLSEVRPFISITTNYDTSGLPDSEYMKSLLDFFGYESSKAPMWYIDGRCYNWNRM
ncbi:hypothetical protein BDZ94DRAFT_1277077 [Collybia nuda]|uniref:Uncharacterized protein n=1 Tax=Collybia nuda TaxID=64659 RepID=A0A9P5XS43_9AGAR|nr:hypothetical protein BDZ94DRAFT_1277077 [Collybia nuda]